MRLDVHPEQRSAKLCSSLFRENGTDKRASEFISRICD